MIQQLIQKMADVRFLSDSNHDLWCVCVCMRECVCVCLYGFACVGACQWHYSELCVYPVLPVR